MGYVGSDRYGFYAGSNTLDPIAETAAKTAPRGGVLDLPANKKEYSKIPFRLFCCTLHLFSKLEIRETIRSKIPYPAALRGGIALTSIILL
jgi:hypothetical protein